MAILKLGRRNEGKEVEFELDYPLTMKKAASRTKDLEDLKYLRKLKKRAEKR